MKKLVAAVCFAQLITARAGAENLVFEKSDSLHRPFNVVGHGISIGHAGLYVNSGSGYSFQKTDALAGVLPALFSSDGLHSVIEAPGYGGGVTFVSFATFRAGLPFWGARVPSGGLTARQRQDALIAAGTKLGASYTLLSGWQGTGNSIRCDGVTAYAYSQAGAPIPTANNGSWRKNTPRSQRDNLVLDHPIAPICNAVTITAVAGGFQITTTANDGTTGSGIDKMEFYTGLPMPDKSNLFATDDHDSDPEAGAAGSNSYTAGDFEQPINVYTKTYDQAGNYSVCNANGVTVQTNDTSQVISPITESITPPNIGSLSRRRPESCGNCRSLWLSA